MDILLTHGYCLMEDEAERRVMKPYPPLGILYLSAYLKSRGVDVTVFDTTFTSSDAFEQFMNDTRPSIVGIYVNLMTRIRVLRMITLCKSLGSTVIVGGPEVPHYAAEFITHGADIAVIGEGEITLEELLPAIHRHGANALHDVAGVAFRDGNGSIVHTPPRPLIPSLDSLPFPDRAAIDIRKYIDTWRAHHGRGSLSLICARGCPFTCTWCSRSVFSDTHRRRSVEKVVDEIELLIGTYSPDQLWFADDVFTINHRWFHDFYGEMKRRNIRIPFECISRADRLNEHVLAEMADLGAFRIWYGSESGSQQILDAMQRRVSVDTIRSVTQLAQKFGIEAGLFVMLGYPGEEIEDIAATVHHLIECKADTFLTTVAYPIKGTTLYDEVENLLLPRGNWDSHTDRSLTFQGRHSDRFYWFATRHLVNEVRYHRMRQSGNGAVVPRLTSLAKSRIAKAGMLLTQHART